MWPFKRRKKSSTNSIPTEVKDYYDSEHRERVGLAWLIAFMSLVLTVAVIVGMFFGGRWAYRKIAGNDNKAVTAVPATNPPKLIPGPSQNTNKTQTKSTSTPKTPSTTSTPKSSSATNSNSSAGRSALVPPPTSNPRRISVTKLTNTGPGNLLAIFAATTIAGMLIHQSYTRRKIRAV